MPRGWTRGAGLLRSAAERGPVRTACSEKRRPIARNAGREARSWPRAPPSLSGQRLPELRRDAHREQPERARGLPPFATIISSPARTSSGRRERWVLARGRSRAWPPGIAPAQRGALKSRGSSGHAAHRSGCVAPARAHLSSRASSLQASAGCPVWAFGRTRAGPSAVPEGLAVGADRRRAARGARAAVAPPVRRRCPAAHPAAHRQAKSAGVSDPGRGLRRTPADGPRCVRGRGRPQNAVDERTQRTSGLPLARPAWSVSTSRSPTRTSARIGRCSDTPRRRPPAAPC